jgi:hypothetical protein
VQRLLSRMCKGGFIKKVNYRHASLRFGTVDREAVAVRTKTPCALSEGAGRGGGVAQRIEPPSSAYLSAHNLKVPVERCGFKSRRRVSLTTNDMTGPNPKKQKAGGATLEAIFADAANVSIIHYSCESFYDRPNGASPRITSIAVRKLDSGQTLSFSVHQVAEQGGVPFGEIEGHYDALERQMLDAFYAHVGGYKGLKYLHWNMRDINYGFAAIEHRHRVLGGTPVIIDDDKKIDLSTRSGRQHQHPLQPKDEDLSRYKIG